MFRIYCKFHSVHCKCYNFSSTFFHKDFTLKPTNKQSNLLDTDTVNAALQTGLFVCFCVPVFFFVDPISHRLLRSFILLGNNSLPLLGLPLLLIFLKTCLKLTMVRTLRRQLPLHWGGTGYLVLPHQGAVLRGRYQVAKDQVCQCFGQSAQASSLGHFGHSRCMQWIRLAFWSFEKCFARAVHKKQVTFLFWIASAPHGNAKPQAQHSHGKTRAASPLRSQSRHRSFSIHVLDRTTFLHEGGGRCQKPQDSCGDG